MQAGCDTKLNFQSSTVGFEFWVFFLLNWLLYQGQIAQSVLQLTNSWGEKKWIQAYLKVINAKWNVNSFFQDLDLGCCV